MHGMPRLRRRNAVNTRTLVAAAVAVGALAAPHAASASDLYVQAVAGDTSCAQDDPCRLQQAITIANIVSNRDTIHVDGPLAYSGLLDLTQSPIDLIGSGSGAGGTTIDVGAAPLRVGSSSSVTGVAVHATDTAVDLFAGATLADARIEAGSSGIVEIPGDHRTTIDHVDVSAGAYGITIIDASPGQATTIRDSHVVARIGVVDFAGVPNPGSLHVERSTIEASRYGVEVAADPNLTIADSVIRATAPQGVGVYVRYDGLARIDDTTIDGAGVGGTGVWIQPGTGGEAVVRGSIVRGFVTDLSAEHGLPADGSVTVHRSDYATSAGARIVSLGGNTNADPHWRGAPAGDYRLAPDSPLIDKGRPDPAGQGEVDRAGNPRVVDGDGDGTATRDVGAFESQDVRPPATTPGDSTTTGPGGDRQQQPVQPEQQQQQQQQQQPQTRDDAPAATGPPAAAALKVKLGGRKLTLDRRGRGTVNVSCSATPCSVSLVLTTTGTRQRTLARGTGSAGKVNVRLSRSALAYVRTSRVRRVAVTASVTDARGRTAASRKIFILF
jgi:hypothetical protein